MTPAEHVRLTVGQRASGTDANQPDAVEAAIAAVAAYERRVDELDTLRAERDAAIIEAVAAGVSMRELARRTGLSAARISRVVNAGNVYAGAFRKAA